MKQGIYEQLINTITKHEISALDPDVYNIGTEKLDAEEARKLLSTFGGGDPASAQDCTGTDRR